MAMKNVEKVGGAELAVEMAAVAGSFECITKVVDATGIKPHPKTMTKVLKGVLTLVKHRMTIGLIGASVATAFVASRFIKKL